MDPMADLTSLAVGAVGWTVAIPGVKRVGKEVAHGGTREKGIAILLGVGLAIATTPFLSYLLGWRTPHERVRGVSLALGAAQATDGLMHLFFPDFYSKDPEVGIACAGNIFYAAGLLGIFSAYS